jgi:cytochrome c biogenesis protein CcdA
MLQATKSRSTKTLAKYVGINYSREDMQKFIMQLGCGIVLFLIGVAFSYVTLKDFNNDNSILLVGVAVVLIILGIFCVTRAKKTYVNIHDTAKAKIEKDLALKAQARFTKKLEEYSESIAQYEKASMQKDQLKVIEIAASENTSRQ